MLLDSYDSNKFNNLPSWSCGFDSRRPLSLVRITFRPPDGSATPPPGHRRARFVLGNRTGRLQELAQALGDEVRNSISPVAGLIHSPRVTGLPRGRVPNGRPRPDQSAYADHLGPRRPSHAAGRVPRPYEGHSPMRASRLPRLRTLGHDRTQGRVREHSLVLPAQRRTPRVTTPSRVGSASRRQPARGQGARGQVDTRPGTHGESTWPRQRRRI
jgi:hypothetical protein